MSKIKDGRSNNGGHSTKGYAGRKPKSAELKVSGYAEAGIIKEYGSITKFWAFVAKESRVSFPHLKMIVDYYAGRPTDSVKIVGKVDVVWEELKTYDR